MEADLQRFYQVDFADHWRRVDGKRVLSLRRLRNLLKHMPDTSAVAQHHNGDRPIPTIEATILGDVWRQLVAQASDKSRKVPVHPLIKAMTENLEQSSKQAMSNRRARAIRRGRSRQLARKQAIARGDIK